MRGMRIQTPDRKLVADLPRYLGVEDGWDDAHMEESGSKEPQFADLWPVSFSRELGWTEDS